MKKPMTLQKFADQHKENYDLIKEVVNLCQEILHYRYAKLCAVCDKELTTEEINSVQAKDFYYCCSQHAAYRSCYTINPIREKLGYEEPIFLNIK